MKTAFEMNKEEKEMWGDDYLNACSALHSDVSDKELMNDIALKVMGYQYMRLILKWKTLSVATLLLRVSTTLRITLQTKMKTRHLNISTKKLIILNSTNMEKVLIPKVIQPKPACRNKQHHENILIEGYCRTCKSHNLFTI
jgi:hypothetical protein